MSSWPNDKTRESVGDVLLVGGTFFQSGARLVLRNGVSFPVDVEIKISPRSGITFPRVRLDMPEWQKKSEGSNA